MAHRLDPMKCPSCGDEQTGTTPADNGPDRVPRAGDLSICATCTAPLVFVLDQGHSAGVSLARLDLADLDLATQGALREAQALARLGPQYDGKRDN